MNLSEKLYKNLLLRAYTYIDSGYYKKEEWSEKMTSFLMAYNDILGLDEADIKNIINEIWARPYKVNNDERTIEEWATLKGETVDHQLRFRNSIDRLFKAIESYRKSKFFLELLRFCARFKLLAPYNAMMVKTQMPEAKYVLTDKNWARMYERRPKRNARPLVILRKYGPVDYVYEIGDTEPIPGRLSLFSEEDILETLAHPYATEGEVPKEIYENLVRALPYYGIELDTFRVAASFGAEIRKTPCEVEVKGVKAQGHYVISINENADMSTAFASICHELGHFFCYHLSSPISSNGEWWKWRSLNWHQREFEAEIVSYVICEQFGVGNKSWEYLSMVLGKNDEIPDGISIDRIFKAANEVERMLAEDLDPRTCLLYKNDNNFKKLYNKKYPHEKSEESAEEE